jgi:hypothetical protein
LVQVTSATPLAETSMRKVVPSIPATGCRGASRGVLLQAGDEYEELKLPFLAHLFAEVCFRDDVSIARAPITFSGLPSVQFRS